MKTYRITVYQGQHQAEFKLRATDEDAALAAAKVHPQIASAPQGTVVWIRHRAVFLRIERNAKNQWVGDGCVACQGKGQCR